jgi:hypothetical protein
MDIILNLLGMILKLFCLRRLVLISALLSWNFPSLLGQFKSNPSIGFQLGAIVQFGSHINALGISGNIYYTDFFYQFNVSSQLKYNFTSLGNRTHFWENRNAAGLMLLAGKKNISPDFQFDALNHQTKFSNALGYNYIWYFDQAGTSQRSGGWGLHLRYFSLLFENDVFGGQQKDRFRTGTIQLNYRYKDWKFFTNLNLWTGETANSFWNKTPLPKCPSGYRCLENLPFGKTSHGILSVGFSRNFLEKQTTSFKIGIDSEHIRHATQNRFAHDLLILPKSVERNTPHYPRLNEEGKPVFEKSEVRKSRIYFQSGINEIWSE